MTHACPSDPSRLAKSSPDSPTAFLESAFFILRDRRQQCGRERRLRYSKPETQQTLSSMPLLRQGDHRTPAREVPDQIHDELHVGHPLPCEERIGAALFQDVFVGPGKWFRAKAPPAQAYGFSISTRIVRRCCIRATATRPHCRHD
jgi:hypothetical protein